jgi:putative colanic acid biosynthesis acetyltransferase WcaF
VVISFGSTLCTATHDIKDPSYPLTGAPIHVGSDVWIAAESFILPGRSIFDGAVVGARSLVVQDVPAWKVVGGNPARVVANRELVA